MNKTSELITFWAHLKPVDIAFADEGHEVNFRELDMYTRKISFLLNKKGIKQGEIVCLILPTYLGWLFTFSLYRLGISTMSQTSLKAFSAEVKPDWLITVEAHPGMSAERTVIVDESYLTLINSSQELNELPGFSNPTDIAGLFSTSGTTGDFKYTAHTAQELSLIATRPGTDDSFGEEGVLSLLMFGAAWVNFHALKCLTFGRTFYACMFTDYRLPKFLIKYPIRTLIGSPVQVSSFLEIQKQTGTKLPLLKTIIMGGSAPTTQLIDRVKSQLDCKLYNSYGATEAGHIAIYEVHSSDDVGAWIRPPMELQIVDDNDNLLPAMSVGHIRYRRDGMATSYYKNPTATAEFFKNGYFYPGDLGFIDHAGRLLLEGRSTEVINLGGVKVNPERIEAIALAQLGVRDCAAFGSINESGIEELCIALVIDSNFDQDHFEKAVKKKSPHVIRQARIVPSIPRTETGKIQRHLLGME